MVWHPDGLLNKYFGVKDFAGGTVVHMSAGFAALAGAIVVGKEKIRIMNLQIFHM
jgi:Amt family ammonium transporter